MAKKAARTRKTRKALPRKQKPQTKARKSARPRKAPKRTKAAARKPPRTPEPPDLKRISEELKKYIKFRREQEAAQGKGLGPQAEAQLGEGEAWETQLESVRHTIAAAARCQAPPDFGPTF